VPLAPGQVLNNRYRILKLLGQGRFGAVYRAWDNELGCPRAVKENLDTSPESQSQFESEAQTLETLSHPSLPKIVDHFVIPGQGQYLVSEFVEGKDLREMLRRFSKPWPEAQALEWIGQICDALGYLHAQTPPVIHRDIKPVNIKITPSGEGGRRAMLVDFGNARIFDPDLTSATGARTATTGYSPPEQYGRGDPDEQSDVFALGCILYHVLTGQVPADSVDVAMGHTPPPPPAAALNPAVSPGVSGAIEKAMQLDRSQRWRSVDELKQALFFPSPADAVAGSPVQQNLAYPSGEALSGGETYPDAAPPMTPVYPAALSETMPVASEAGKRSLPWGWIGAALGLIVLLFLAALFVLRRLPPFASTSAGLAAGTPLAPAMVVVPSPTAYADSLPLSLTDDKGVEMALVPAGEFLMGSTEADPDAYDDEKPQHAVYLDAFYIDLSEVTNDLFTRFVEATGYRTEAEKAGHGRVFNTSTKRWEDISGADWHHPRGPSSSLSGLGAHPVVQVSWNDASAYCAWRGARLPTEAEWEKAERGWDGRIYPWEDGGPQGDLLNFADRNLDVDWADKTTDDGFQFTAPVGSYPAGASPYGMLDMAGNVWEWTQDWYLDTFYQGSPFRNPLGPSAGEHRVVRGGSWINEAKYLRAAFRSGYEPATWSGILGFRCARSP
jgi:formylglycine-generating enzyme required for sulfatase activity